MKTDEKSKIGSKIARRDVLRVVGLGAGAAMVPPLFIAEARADTENDSDKRKARYNANSEHIKAFYRVNGYPK
jgi:hypothetical protein